MTIDDIISVSGKGGLFQIISKTNNGLIVESLEDKKRMPVFGSDNVSSFSDISIYTTDDSTPLKEVFQKISEKENGGKCMDANSDPAKLKAYLAEVLPDYDEDRVYMSHIKKLMKWYNILQELGLLKELLKDDEKTDDDNDKGKASVKGGKGAVKKSIAKSIPRAREKKMNTGNLKNIRKAQ